MSGGSDGKTGLPKYSPEEISLPAIGQGAVGIECRIDDSFIIRLSISSITLQPPFASWLKGPYLKRLEGGCQVPIAAHASCLTAFHLIIDGIVGSITGDRIVKSRIEGNPDHAESLGFSLAENLLAMGAKKILDEVYGKGHPAGKRRNKQLNKFK